MSSNILKKYKRSKQATKSLIEQLRAKEDETIALR